MSRVLALIFENSRKVSKVKIDPSEDDFDYKGHTYDINPKKIYLMRNRPCLIYFEGYSEPIGHDDIKIKDGNPEVFISSKQVHDFASKKILSVLLRSKEEDIQLILLIVIIILSLASIVVGVMF